ncbi:hypothetical protein E2C01_070021 [Portunus trituberculatus]|uniref:Uncharacterized protein n=1 Tax=Portunus trituberculatus TaxID=210409 RepID=A0A5B7I420_PORTR|nr:hypothetical protein [Portunus trituberculatus]
MLKEIAELRAGLEKVKNLNTQLQEENDNLKKQLRSEMMDLKKQSVKVVEEKQSVWIKQREGNEESLKKIVEKQQKEKQGITDKVISVIKEKKKLVRDTVDKVKCVVVFGVREEKIVNRSEREAKEKEEIKNILMTVAEEGNQAINLVEEFHRFGKFEEQKERPLKIKFATQVQAVVVLNGSWKLASNDELKNVWINKDLDEEEERTRVKELVTEAKQKNDMRTEDEKEQFYWRVRDLRLRKKFIRR